jgi:hypothetical protein
MTKRSQSLIWPENQKFQPCRATFFYLNLGPRCGRELFDLGDLGRRPARE